MLIPLRLSIESQQKPRTPGKRKHSATPSASVSLAGMSLTFSANGTVEIPDDGTTVGWDDRTVEGEYDRSSLKDQ